MYESFQGASIMGIDLPLPNMAVARPLEITYLDEDIMIARNDGGEPHLLVRIRRSCPEEYPDHKFSGFFEDARLLSIIHSGDAWLIGDLERSKTMKQRDSKLCWNGRRIYR